MTDRLRLSSSHIELNGQCADAIELLKERPVLFIEGKPFIGTTTFLKNIGADLEKAGRKVYFISAATGMARDCLFKILEKKLGLDSQQDDQLLTEKILHRLEQENAFILIDDLDLISESKRVLEFFIQNALQTRVVATGKQIPDIDPQLSMDFHLFQYEGMTDAQMKAFVEKSASILDPKDRETIISNLVQQAEGSAFFIKSMLSPFLLKKRIFKLSDVGVAFFQASTQYFETGWSELSEKAREILLIANLIEYDQWTQNDIIRTIDSANDRTTLLQFEFALERKENSLFQIIRRSHEFLASKFKKLKAEQILSLYEKAAEALRPRLHERYSLKDLLHLMNERPSIRSPMSLTDVANRFSELCIKEGDLSGLVEMTDSCWKVLNPENFLRRVRHFPAGFKHDQAIQELQEYLDKNNLENLDKLHLSLELGLLLGTTEKYNEAKSLIESILHSTQLGSKEHILALIYLAKTTFDRDFSFAEKSLAEAATQIATYQCKDSFVAINYVKTRIFMSFENSSFPDNYKNDVELLELSKSYSAIDKIFSPNFRLQIEYYHGGIFDKSQFDDMIESLKRAFLPGEVSAQEGFKLQYQAIQGQAICASDLCENEWFPKCSKIIRRPFYLYRFAWAFNIFHHARKIDKALNMAIQALFHPTISQSHYYQTLFAALSEILSLSLKGDPSKGIRSYINLPIFISERLFVTRIALSEFLQFGNCKEDDLEALLIFESETTLHHREVGYFERLLFRIFVGIALIKNQRTEEALSRFEICYHEAKQRNLYRWQLMCLIGILVCRDPKVVFWKQEEFQKDLIEIKPHLEALEDIEAAQILENYLSQTNLSELPPLPLRLRNYFQSGPRIQTKRILSVVSSPKLPIIDRERMAVWVEEKCFAMSHRPVAFKLLCLLYDAKGEAVSKESLVNAIWTEDYNPMIHDTRIYTNMNRLRRFLTESKMEASLVAFDGTYALKLNALISNPQAVGL